MIEQLSSRRTLLRPELQTVVDEINAVGAKSCGI